MEPRPLYIRFGQESIDLIDKLKGMFGTEDRAEIVAHALSFAVAAREFAHDGVVKVLEPSVDAEGSEAGVVNLVIDRNRPAGRQAA